MTWRERNFDMLRPWFAISMLSRPAKIERTDSFESFVSAEPTILPKPWSV